MEEFNSIERETLEHEREEKEERQDEINMGVDEANEEKLCKEFDMEEGTCGMCSSCKFNKGIVVDEVQVIDTELKKKLSTYFNNK